jgi:hypothetical protein
MAKTYEKIATSTVTTATASQTITLNSIPSTYTDLRIVISGTTNTGGKVVYLRFNGDTGTNYNTCELHASSASIASGALVASANGIKCNSQGTPNPSYAFLVLADVLNYASSTSKKPVLTQAYEVDGTSRGPARNSGVWTSNNAITSVTLATSSGTFNEVVATIYGIKQG